MHVPLDAGPQQGIVDQDTVPARREAVGKVRADETRAAGNQHRPIVAGIESADIRHATSPRRSNSTVAAGT